MKRIIITAYLAAAMFACGAPPPEFEVFGQAAEGIVESDADGVLQTNGDHITVVARWNGAGEATVYMHVGPQVNVEDARVNDGTALPEVMETEVEPVTAGKREASVFIKPLQWRSQPGSAYRVRAEAWRGESLVGVREAVAWVGDAPSERL